MSSEEPRQLNLALLIWDQNPAEAGSVKKIASVRLLYETHARKACSRLFNWQWRSTIGLCIFPFLSNCAVIAATSGLIVMSVISLYCLLEPFRY